MVDVGDGRNSKEAWRREEGGDIDLNELANSEEVEATGWIDDDTALRVFPVRMESDCSDSLQSEVSIDLDTKLCWQLHESRLFLKVEVVLHDEHGRTRQ